MGVPSLQALRRQLEFLALQPWACRLQLLRQREEYQDWSWQQPLRRWRRCRRYGWILLPTLECFQLLTCSQAR